MDSIDEKRVYDGRGGATEAYVASSTGVCRVRISGDAVGEFGLLERCVARDVTTGRSTLAVATDEDVLVADSPVETGSQADARLEATGFGPAVAVGYDGECLVAAAPDGRVARRRTDEWTELERRVSADVRAIDGDLLATADGVARLQGDRLVHAGLETVSDVSAAGIPLAATPDGLFKLGNGWMQAFGGAVDVVAADPRSAPGSLARAHAAAGETLYEHDGGDWLECVVAEGPIAGIGYGETVYAVTEDGSFLTASEDGWRTQAIGVVDVSGLAVSVTQQFDRV